MDDSSALTTILIVGDLFAPDMWLVRQRIEELARAGREVRAFLRVAEAVANCSLVTRHPDLAVICQHWPDEFTPREVRELLKAFPLARLVCCYGPWCASDGRTRDVWPLAVRVPAALSARRIDLELEVLQGSRAPLPLTASRDEIFLFDPEMPIEALAS
jgi:hypothetical protein